MVEKDYSQFIVSHGFDCNALWAFRAALHYS